MLLSGLGALCTISDYLSLILASLVQYLTKSMHLTDQPSLRIPEGIDPPLNRRFPLIDYALNPRCHDDLMHDLYNLLIIQLIVYFPLTLISTGSSL